MPRPRHLISTLLLALAVWLWARSYGGADVLLLLGPGGRAAAVASWRGQLLVGASTVSLGDERAWTILPVRPTDDETIELAHRLLADPTIRRAWGGFLWARSAPGGNALGVPGAGFGAVAVPHWLIVTLAAIAPLRATRRQWVVHRRRKTGRCAACGYDLRESTGQCSECGAPIAPK